MLLFFSNILGPGANGGFCRALAQIQTGQGSGDDVLRKNYGLLGPEKDLGGQLMLKKNKFLFTRIVEKQGHTLYLMENKNGIDNLAGSVVNGNVRSNDPQVGGSGIAGPEIAGFESPEDYP